MFEAIGDLLDRMVNFLIRRAREPLADADEEFLERQRVRMAEDRRPILMVNPHIVEGYSLMRERTSNPSKIDCIKDYMQLLSDMEASGDNSKLVTLKFEPIKGQEDYSYLYIDEAFYQTKSDVHPEGYRKYFESYEQFALTAGLSYNYPNLRKKFCGELEESEIEIVPNKNRFSNLL